MTEQSSPEDLLSYEQRVRLVLAKEARGILTNTTLVSSSSPSAKEVIRLATWLEGEERMKDLWQGWQDLGYLSEDDLPQEPEQVIAKTDYKLICDRRSGIPGSPLEAYCDLEEGHPDPDGRGGHLFTTLVSDKPKWQLSSAQVAERERIRKARQAHGFGEVHDRYPGRAA